MHIVFIEASGTGAGETTCSYAKKKGHKVTLVSRSPESYSSAILANVDHTIKSDTNSLEELKTTLFQLDKETKIHGITTTNDFYVPNASFGAEFLQLPSLTYQAAIQVRNKFKMRENIERLCPQYNPTFALVGSEEAALVISQKWGFPFICKPQNLNDSLDVKLVRSEKELLEYLQIAKNWDKNDSEQSIEKEILFEGFIDGEEYSVETYQYYDQDIQLIGITKKIMTGFENGHFVELGVTFYAKGSHADFLFKEVANVLGALKINCGVIHTECRIVNGQVKILEINPRLIGDMAGSHLIEECIGVNPSALVVDIALGIQNEFKSTKNEEGTLIGLIPPRSGIFKEIKNIELIKSIPEVKKIGAIRKAGSFVHVPLLSNLDIVARLVVVGASSTKTAQEIIEKAVVEIENPN